MSSSATATKRSAPGKSRAPSKADAAKQRAALKLLQEHILTDKPFKLDPTLLRRLFSQMGKGIETNQSLYREVFSEIRKISMGLDGEGASPALRRTAFEILTAIFERGRERGDISRSQSPEVLATAFDSLLSGAVVQWLHDRRRGSLPALLGSLINVFLDGAARPPR